MLQQFSSSTQSREASVSPKHQDTARHKVASWTKCGPTFSYIMFRKTFHTMGRSRQEKERSCSSLCRVLAWSDSGSLQLITLSFFSPSLSAFFSREIPRCVWGGRVQWVSLLPAQLCPSEEDTWALLWQV